MEANIIRWENINYNSQQAKEEFESMEISTRSFNPIILDSNFQELRDKLIQSRNYVFEEYNLEYVNKLDYKFDLLYGLEIYKILNSHIGFSNRVATSDDIWRYLSVKVIPDIVHSRWGWSQERYFATTRRIWLKSIWWYIHLAWKGDSESTYEILKGNTTDTILNLVERPGLGYYVEVYRELMNQYYNYEDKSRELFRAVLKLNTAKLLTTSPELVEGGINKYVHSLFLSAGAVQDNES